MLKLKASAAIGLALAVLSMAVLIPSSSSAYSNGEYGTGAYGACDYGVDCSISLTSNGNISLDVTPAAGGKCTIDSDSPSVLTDDTNGYTLTLANVSNGTSLINGSYSISASSGTLSSPTALTANSWGYRVDGLGSFGSGPTTTQTNISPSGALFAGVVANNLTADVIASTSGAADPAQTTTVWFGTCADTSVGSGTYTSQVLYTAVAN